MTLGRQDICGIQLTKAAIRAGRSSSGDVEAASLKHFFVASAFGSHLGPRSAVRVGLFLSVPAARIQQVGNAAGFGARQMLASTAKRTPAEDLASQIEYIELTNHPRFHEQFVNALLL